MLEKLFKHYDPAEDEARLKRIETLRTDRAAAMARAESELDLAAQIARQEEAEKLELDRQEREAAARLLESHKGILKKALNDREAAYHELRDHLESDAFAGLVGHLVDAHHLVQGHERECRSLAARAQLSDRDIPHSTAGRTRDKRQWAATPIASLGARQDVPAMIRSMLIEILVSGKWRGPK